MTFDPGPLDDVTRAGEWTLVFVRELRQSPDVVWTALPDPTSLDQWAPFSAARDLGVEGSTTLTLVDGTDKTDIPAFVAISEAPTLLEFTWGEDRLRWELSPSGGGT